MSKIFILFAVLALSIYSVQSEATELKNLAIFGGTGMIGSEAVRYALEKGKHVRLLVRNESTLPADFKDKVEVIKGDVLNKSDVERTLDGVDGVIIILGTRNNLSHTTVMSEGTKNIIEAMKESGLTKFSACLSSFIFREPSAVPPIFREIDADHRRMYEIVLESGLDFRAVMPPHVTADQSRDFQTLYDKSPGRSISKYDLGKFFVDCLENEEHSKKVIGIANAN